MLHTLSPTHPRQKKAQKVGRGNGSKGNTCGRGMKGQKSRAGGGPAPWFEGGQTPLFMRLPKLRGFKRYFKLLVETTAVSITSLETHPAIVAGAEVTPELLSQLGLLKSVKSRVKILGKGPLTKTLTISKDVAVSKSARECIENAGGTINS